MKTRILSSILAIIMITSALTVLSLGAKAGGDVNGDGKVNAKDVTTIMKYLIGKTPSSFDVTAADFNNDGKVNAKDVTSLMKSLVGTEVDTDTINEAISAYKLFVAQKHHEDEWIYDIDKFALHDLNNDGTPELFILGGGQMDYSKIFTYKNGKVAYVHWGSSFTIYDNGVIYYGFNSGDGYSLHTYYAMKDNLEMDLRFRYAEWHGFEGTSYSVGEKAYENDSVRVPFENISNKLNELINGANTVKINYHEINDPDAWNIK